MNFSFSYFIQINRKEKEMIQNLPPQTDSKGKKPNKNDS